MWFSIPKRHSLTIMLLLVTAHQDLFTQQSMLDAVMPTKKQIRASLAVLRKFSSSKPTNAGDILRVYNAEKVVGRCVWEGTQAWRHRKVWNHP